MLVTRNSNLIHLNSKLPPISLIWHESLHAKTIHMNNIYFIIITICVSFIIRMLILQYVQIVGRRIDMLQPLEHNYSILTFSLFLSLFLALSPPPPLSLPPPPALSISLSLPLSLSPSLPSLSRSIALSIKQNEGTCLSLRDKNNKLVYSA